MRFSSDISMWWLLPLAIVAGLLGWWLYQRKDNSWIGQLSNRALYLLITLRSLGIFLIALLLFGLIFQAFNTRKERPIVIIGIDDSASMLNYKDSADVPLTTANLLREAKNKLGDKFEVLPYTFSNEPKTLKTEKVAFTSQKTDLNNALQQTKTEFYNRNLAAILIISDGNYNTGANPVYSAEKFTTSSIYALAVGDTTTKRDQLIKHLAYNDVAFLKNDFPVLIDIEGNRMGKISTEVSIEHNGKKIASQSIIYKDGVSDFEQVQFQLNASTPGVQRYDVYISKQSNEYNYENNHRTFYVEVIDSRSKILLLSAGPHPDLGALKSVWDKDQNLEVEFKLLSDWNRDLKNVDLIVLHDPGAELTKDYQQAIFGNSISKLIIVGSQANASTISQLGLGMEIPSGKRLDDQEGTINKGFNAFEVSADLAKAFEFYPPLKALYGKLKIPNNAMILSHQRVGPVLKNEAQIFFAQAIREGKNFKYGVIYGEGLWRWKLAEYGRTATNKSFDELIGKTGQYLMVKQNTDPFRVQVPKTAEPDEPITINATILNVSLEPITSATVYFELSDEKNRNSKLQFGVSGTNYQLDLGLMESGSYTWKAYTNINGKYHEKKGEFIVKKSFLESRDNKANHAILRQLTENTDGKFALLKDYLSLLDSIKNREDFSTNSYRESSFNELIEYFILFMIITLVLFTEWFLRRYWGSY